jgi:tripartite-type tricarboxylate transporter receptor subunit TctC
MRIVKLPEIQSKLRELELTPVGNSSKDFADMLAKDIAMWAEVARAANVKIN